MKLKLLFAAVMMSVATVVSASAMSNVTGNAGMATTVENQRDMLAVTSDDTINIKVTGVSGSLTLLSYKNGQEPSPDNIQYIRQYTPDASGDVDVTFKIRSIIPKGQSGNSENGLYCVKLNDGAGAVNTLYYKVGKPSNITAGTDVNYFQKVDFTRADEKGEGEGTISVAYKANFKLSGGCVNEYGFTVMYDNDTKNAKNSFVKEFIFEGSGEFSFGVTVHDIENAEDVNKISAIPYVNYVENNSAVVVE